MENKSNGNKTIIWVAVGCFVLVACIVAVFIFGFGGLVWLGLQTPENAEINVDTPIQVSEGDNVEIRVLVTNTSSTALEVFGIDISMNYLDGFIVTQTSPPYSDSRQFDSLGGGETYQSYYFYRQVLPGESLSIVFHARAVRVGDFSGDLDVCIDSDYTCATNVIRTLVR